MKIKAISVTAARDNNQDSLLIGSNVYCGTDFLDTEIVSADRVHVFAIADGAGGASLGERLSAIAVKTLLNSISHTITDDCEPQALKALVMNAFRNAQEQILSELMQTDTIGGTTLSVLVISGNKYFSFNIGDSPVFLVRNKKLSRLSVPHTLAQYKIDQGFSADQIFESDYHCLIQSLGTFGYTDIYCVEGDILPGDMFIVMSDGLELLGEKKLQKMLLKSNLDPRKKSINKLNDNISVIIVNL